MRENMNLIKFTDTNLYPIALSTSPTSGFAKVGQTVSKITGGIWTCIKSLEKKTVGITAIGATTITVDSSTDLANGDVVGILLDDKTTHWTIVSGLVGATFTITALPSQASANNRIVFNAWKSTTIELLTADPISPSIGEMWLRSDL